MTISENHAQYQAWVAANPKIFKVANTNIVCKSEDVGAKVIEVTTASGSIATSVQVVDNTVTLEGFLAWADQVCGC